MDRIGQTKPTCVHRFIAGGTIEDTVRSLSASRQGNGTDASSTPQVTVRDRDEFAVTRRDVLRLFSTDTVWQAGSSGAPAEESASASAGAGAGAGASVSVSVNM